MLTVAEAPHNSFLSFDLWYRNSPTSFFFQFFVRMFSNHLFICPQNYAPPFLEFTWNSTGGNPLPAMFLGPLVSCFQVGSKEETEGQEEEKKKASDFPQLPCSRHLLLWGYISLWLACVAPDPSKQTHVSHVPWWTSSPLFPSNPRVGSSLPQWPFLRFPCLLVVLPKTFLNVSNRFLLLNYLAWFLVNGRQNPSW